MSEGTQPSRKCCACGSTNIDTNATGIKCLDCGTWPFTDPEVEGVFLVTGLSLQTRRMAQRIRFDSAQVTRLTGELAKCLTREAATTQSWIDFGAQLRDRALAGQCPFCGVDVGHFPAHWRVCRGLTPPAGTLPQ